MRLSAFLCCVAVLSVTDVQGTPVDNAIVAAMKLREAGSYQWIATVEDDSRFYTIEGKTRPDGYTLVNMPMVDSIQRRIGGSGSEIQTAVFRGDADFVVETREGWKTRTELAAVPLPPSPWQKVSGRRPGVPGAGTRVIRPGHPAFRYSNLQLNLSHPHDEIGIIVGSYSDIQCDPAGGVTGTLSEEGAKLLLVHPGQNEITPLHASGTFKLWLERGVLVKYEVHLTGTISVGVGPDRWEISLRQSVITDLRGVGTTTFEVPEEAKRKLG